MKNNHAKLVLVLDIFVILCSFAATSPAVIREVGTGKTYTTIQAAITAAGDSDEIIIYAGTYAEDVTIVNKNYLYIHASGSDRVTVRGSFNLWNPSSATWSDNNLIEGIYFDKTAVASGWCVQHQYARSNEYRNCVFYGDGSGAHGIYGNLEYGLNIARHCTFYGLYIPYSNGYAAGLHVMDSIVAFNGGQSYNYPGYAGVATYSNYYMNPVGPGLPTYIGDTTGTIFVDPEFKSTDPYSSYFLAPDETSPCKGTASDGNDMGATPRAPAFTILEVGPGKNYATIQAAVNAATGGEIILVYEGIYEETVNIDVSSGSGPLGVIIRANDGDTVVVKGGFFLNGSSSYLCEGIVISGFYIDKRGALGNSWGIYCNYARNNTFSNCVIFGDGGGTSGAGIYGASSYGLNIAKHCTLYGLYTPYSNGSASGLHVYNSIVAFNDNGAYNYSGYGGAAKYSDFYNNPGVSGLPFVVGDTTGTIEADPLFMSAAVHCQNFLWLNQTNSPCVGTAENGGNMGALPDTNVSECIEDPNAPGDPNWTFMYQALAWPTDDVPGGSWGGYGTPVEIPEWFPYNYYGYGEPQSSPGVAYFRCRTSPGGYLYYTKKDNDSNYPAINFDFATGTTVEVRLKLYSDGASYSDGGTAFVVCDGDEYAAVNIIGKPSDPGTYQIRLQGNGTAADVSVNTAIWHTYRLTVEDGVARLFIDGNNVPLLTKNTAPTSSPTGYVYWGDGSSYAAGYAYWDYIKVYCYGAVPGPYVTTLSIDPNDGESMPRVVNNVIRIVESGTIAGMPPVPLQITKVGTQTNVASSFTYALATTTETNDTLIATENGDILENDTWYRIEPAGFWTDPFIVNAVAFEGDIDSDLDVDFGDLAQLAGRWTDSGSALGNVDLNADGTVDFEDFTILGGAWKDAASLRPWTDVNAVEYSGNPVMIAGSEPSGAVTIGVLHVCVRKKDAFSPYMMWYSGDISGGGARRIYLATSGDGISWTKQGQVLSESGHTMGPCVVWDESANLWKMWYTSGTIAYGIYYATSSNGATWSKYGGNPVFERGSNPSDWDATSVRYPAVIYDAEESLYKMWYWGNNNSNDPGGYGEHGTGYATSPDGINWTRQGQISDESRLITGEVIKLNGIYYMFHNVSAHIGYSMSLDGISWDDDPDNPVITAGEVWCPSYIQAPSILYDSAANLLRIYYNGANYSLPADGTTIGLATTTFVP